MLIISFCTKQTVNTASRMETNSAPYRIHVSESTADLIIAADKGYVWVKQRINNIVTQSIPHTRSNSRFGSICICNRHWLEPRETEINVKGKGSMQTYWCNPANDVTSNDDTSSHHGGMDCCSEAPFHDPISEIWTQNRHATIGDNTRCGTSRHSSSIWFVHLYIVVAIPNCSFVSSCNQNRERPIYHLESVWIRSIPRPVFFEAIRHGFKYLVIHVRFFLQSK